MEGFEVGGVVVAADILTVNGSLRLLSRAVVVLMVLNLVMGFTNAISAAIFSKNFSRKIGSLKLRGIGIYES